MVSQSKAITSSTITAALVSLSHGAAHYLLEGATTLTDPVVMTAGATVFTATWILSYTGMQGLLPF